MAKKKSTAGSRQLNVEIDAGLRDRLDERIAVERRTLRTIVEMALTLYLETPPNGIVAPGAPAPPRRGRPRTAAK